MRFVVLGSSASYADAGRACAGYLVTEGGTSILLDCGHGALANLTRVADPSALDAVFVSHAHPDHVADLYALGALLRYAPAGPLPPLRLFGPSGLVPRLSCLLNECGAAEIAKAFDDCGLEDGSVVRVGDLEVRADGVEHARDTFALTITGHSGARLCYGADGRACDALVEAARDADLLLAEATLPQAYAGKAPHMTAREAAGVAAQAGVRTLVLTHVWPTTDRDGILEEAREVFGGKILVAEELKEIQVVRGGSLEGKDTE